MSGLFDGLPIGGISAGALVGIIVMLILIGRLVPRQQLLDLREDRDKWQQSSEKWQAVATQHGMTLERLVEYADAADHALTAIQAAMGKLAEEQR